MKHILCLCLTALLCCLLYTGCKQQPASFVQSAQLSQNEQALLQLLEIEQPQLFDFSVQGAKSLSLELFTLENGSWKPAGSFSGNIDQPSCTGRILCRTDPDTHQISSLAVENLGSIQRIQPQMESLPAATGYGQSAISGRTDITLEQPVALCVSTSTGSKRMLTPTTCPTMRWKIRRKSKAMPHSWSPSPFLRSRLPDFCVAQAVKSGKNGSDVV